MILSQSDNLGTGGPIGVIGDDRIGIFWEVDCLVVDPGVMRLMVDCEVVSRFGPGIIGPEGLNRLGVLNPVAGPVFQVVIARLACLGRIQFPIGDQLRLSGIMDGGCRRGGDGDQISRDRAHDLVIDTNLSAIITKRNQRQW